MTGVQTCALPISRIDKIVCFGLGSPMGKKQWLDDDIADAPGLEPVTRSIHRDSFTQLAVALEMAALLEAKMGQAVQVYCQDSDYSAEDEKAMEQLGVEVLDGAYGAHEGFVMVDDTTLVYDCMLSLSTVRMIVPYVRPAAIICPWLNPDEGGPNIKAITLRHGEWNDGEDVVISTPDSLTKFSLVSPFSFPS